MTNKENVIIEKLEKAGYEAYKVGGCVRNHLLGLPNNDVDLTTSATPDEIAEVFNGKRLDFVGKRFGVTLIDGIEVATYRTETYNKPRKPNVQLVRSLKEDLSRRDFTINAMVMKEDGTIIDYFNGQEDLQLKLIRAVGNPWRRFNEDPSRILRGIYLASYLGFDIEKETRRIMQEQADWLKEVPVEAVGLILMKVMKHNCLSKFLLWLKELELVSHVFPALAHTLNLPQNPKYHNSDVFEHIVRVVQSAERRYPGNKVMSLGALLHDVAKGLPGVRGFNREGQPNDLTHEVVGVPIAKEVLQSLQFEKEIVKIVLFIVEFHGLRLPENVKKKSVVKALRKFAPFFSSKQELKEGVDDLFRFMECDADGFEPSFGEEMTRINKIVWRSFNEVLNEMVFYRSELPVSGEMIMQYGFHGKEVGRIFELLIENNLQTKEMIEAYLEKRKENSL